MRNTLEEVNILTRSPIRVRLLEELFEYERMGKDPLKDSVKGSRTAIQRNLDILEERGWVQGNNKEYWITQTGKPVVGELLELLNTIYNAKRLQPLFECIPPKEFDLEFSSIATADIVISNKHDPYAPINYHIDLMKSTDRFRCLLPTVGLQSLVFLHNQINRYEGERTIVLDRDVVDTLQANYRELIQDILTNHHLKLLVSDRALPFYLGLAEEVVQIGVGDDQDILRVVLQSEEEEVLEWAEKKYETFKTQATHYGNSCSSYRVD